MDDTQRTSTWRDKYKVHPAADVFPMMSDEGLAQVGQDIRAHGLKEPLSFCWVELGPRPLTANCATAEID